MSDGENSSESLDTDVHLTAAEELIAGKKHTDNEPLFKDIDKFLKDVRGKPIEQEDYEDIHIQINKLAHRFKKKILEDPNVIKEEYDLEGNRFKWEYSRKISIGGAEVEFSYFRGGPLDENVQILYDSNPNGNSAISRKSEFSISDEGDIEIFSNIYNHETGEHSQPHHVVSVIDPEVNETDNTTRAALNEMAHLLFAYYDRSR